MQGWPPPRWADLAERLADTLVRSSLTRAVALITLVSRGSRDGRPPLVSHALAVTMHALLVCDNTEETALLSFVLQAVGATVTPVCDLEKGMQALIAKPPDIVLLCLRQSSLTAQVRRVRRDTDACLAVISNPFDEDELCQAFEAGADMIVLRPFSARLLTSQLRALLRRGRGSQLGILPLFTVGELTLDPTTRTVRVEDRPPRRLTQLEFRLLYTLVLHRGQTVLTETIVERVWGYGGEGDKSLVRGLIRRVRTKVEEVPQQPQYIVSVPGLGYRLDIPED